MKVLEADAKALLRAHGLAVPRGTTATTGEAAAQIADDIGRCVVKAQVPAGGRGKAGGVVMADDAAAAEAAAVALLVSSLGELVVNAVLVEERLDIESELYLAVVIDTSAGRPMIMASSLGGIEVEAASGSMTRVMLDPGVAITDGQIAEVATALGIDERGESVIGSGIESAIRAIHHTFDDLGALLVEVNPLVVTVDGHVIAADAKIELDDAVAHPALELSDSAESGTELELEAAERGLRLIELGGNVAILANGAGLTMTTMDAVSHHGGTPANFLEIGGDAYTLAEPALELTLRQSGVRSLLVNFCGAFARCDVMTEGVVNALESLRPGLPVFFSIHGTGQDEAREMVRTRLGIEPFESMDDAVLAAVEAAR